MVPCFHRCLSVSDTTLPRTSLIETPELVAPTVDLGVYDALLAEVRS